MKPGHTKYNSGVRAITNVHSNGRDSTPGDASGAKSTEKAKVPKDTGIRE